MKQHLSTTPKKWHISHTETTRDCRDKAAAIADKNSESHPRELAFANATWVKTKFRLKNGPPKTSTNIGFLRGGW